MVKDISQIVAHRASNDIVWLYNLPATFNGPDLILDHSKAARCRCKTPFGRSHLHTAALLWLDPDGTCIEPMSERYGNYWWSTLDLDGGFKIYVIHLELMWKRGGWWWMLPKGKKGIKQMEVNIHHPPPSHLPMEGFVGSLDRRAVNLASEGL